MYARTTLVVMYHPTLPSFQLTTEDIYPSFTFRNNYREGVSATAIHAFHWQKNMKDLLVWASLTTTTYEEPDNRLCGSCEV